MSTTEAINDTGALNKQKTYLPPGGGMSFGSPLPHALNEFQPPPRVRSTPPSLTEQQNRNYFPQKSNMRVSQRPYNIYPQPAFSNIRSVYPSTTSPSMMAQTPIVHPASPTGGLPRGRPPSPSVSTGGGDTTPRGRPSGRGGRMVRVSSGGRLAQNGNMEPQSPSSAGMADAFPQPRGNVSVYTPAPGQNVLQARPPPPYMVNSIAQPYPPLSLQPQPFQPQQPSHPQHRQPHAQHMLPSMHMLQPIPGQMSPAMHPIVHQVPQHQPHSQQQLQHHLPFSPTLHPGHPMQPPLAHLATPAHLAPTIDTPMQLAPPHKQPVFYPQPHFAGPKPTLTLGPSAANNAAAVAAANNGLGVINSTGPSKALLIIDPDTGKDIFSHDGHHSTLLASSPEFEMAEDQPEKKYERRLEILTPPHSPALSPSISSFHPDKPSQNEDLLTVKTPDSERDSHTELVSPAVSQSPRNGVHTENASEVTLHVPSILEQPEVRPSMEEATAGQKRKKDKFEHLKGVVLPPTSGSAPSPFLDIPQITVDNSSQDDESVQEESLHDMPESPEISECDDLTDEDLDVPEPTENGVKDPSCFRYVYPTGFLLGKRHLFTLLPTEGKMHKDITKDADDSTPIPAEQWQRGRTVTTPRFGSGRAVSTLKPGQSGGLSLRKKTDSAPQWGAQPRQPVRPAARADRTKPFGGRRGEASAPMNIFVKPLEKTESRWERGTPITDETDKILRRIRLILNKLSLDKLTVLAQQAIELLQSSVDRASLLREVIVVIFDKALSEKYFAGMYSKLCVKLSAALPKLDEKIEKDGVVTTQKTSFRRILLNKCQEEFERGTEKLDATAGDVEKLRQQKARMLGNITFIGELYKSNMIGERIMHECVDHLMHDEESEEDLHALCDFLTTIGQKLDQPLAAERMAVYFKQLEKLSNSKTLPSRSRFMCMDLIELRANKWIPRRKKNEAMTREEVHKESVKESSQKSLGGDVRIKKKPESSIRPSVPVVAARPATKDRFALQTDLPKPEPVRDKSEHRDKDREREHRRDRSKERDRDRDSRRSSRDRDRDAERSKAESRERSRGEDRKESRRTSSSDHRSSDRSRDRRSNERDHSREKEKHKSRESRHRHRDGSKSKHSSRDSERKSSDEEAVKKMSSALKEYGEAQDFNEVVQCVKELKSSKHWLVVRVALQQSMDPNTQLRERNTSLLVRLCQSGALSGSDFDDGIRAFLPLLDEVVEDCPHAAKWAAEMIANWVQNRCASLRFLSFSSQPDTPISDHLEKLVGYLLQTLLGLVGLDVLKKEYQEAGIHETSFLHQPLQDFIAIYKLSSLFNKG